MFYDVVVFWVCLEIIYLYVIEYCLSLFLIILFIRDKCFFVFMMKEGWNDFYEVFIL